jgi:ferric-dicitrate binding protein FerR (iron transport regulator)
VFVKFIFFPFGGYYNILTLTIKDYALNKEEFLLLVDKYLEGKANNEEIDLLSRYYNSFQEDGNWNASEMGSAPETDARLFKRILEKIKANSINKNQNNDNVFHFGKGAMTTIMFKFAVAASLIGLLILGSYLWINSGGKKELATKTIKSKPYKNDVPPGGDKAVLTLADGSTIVLDDAKNGDLTRQGNTKVIKLNGKLAYNNGSTGVKEVLYNTISTPRGGQYQVELPDGTQVWLNAASSLHFPTAFAGKERRVEITGEAYFEVAVNKTMPFIVSIQGAEIQVLGTHFNVMAYNDEAMLNTTLLEGSIKFVKGNTNSLLKPGQQSQLAKNGEIKVVNDVDVENVIAWKNGNFHLEDADIKTVMRQIARWYDVEIVYQHKETGELYYLEMPRSSTLADILKVLEIAGNIHFQIDGSKVIVLPVH